MRSLSIQALIDCGVHIGCRVSRWNPKMAPYIYGRRNLIHIIDARETLRGLLRAQSFLRGIAAEGAQILWVGTKRQVKGVIKDAGEQTGMPVVTERWIGGTLTNFSVIRSRLRRLEELEAMEENGALAIHSKKMISTLRRERKKIERNLSGIREMNAIPGAMVVIDPGRESNAVKEARRLGVPVIGLLDTDCDPSVCDIVIPGNDDALRSVRLLLSQLVVAVEEGCAARREQIAALGEIERRKIADVGDEPRPTRGNKAIRGKLKRGPSQPETDETLSDHIEGERELELVGPRRGTAALGATATESTSGWFTFDARVPDDLKAQFLDAVRLIARGEGVSLRILRAQRKDH